MLPLPRGRAWLSLCPSFAVSALPLGVRTAQCYSPLIKRNRVPFVDFETGAPKDFLSTQSVVAPFTLSKQKKIEKLLDETHPKKTFRGRVIRQLSVARLKHSGRNNEGHLVVRHRGGGCKQRLRFVDFKRGRKDMWCTVLRVEYAPDRTAHLALVQYTDGVLSYIVATQTMRAGDKVIASAKAPIAPGNCLPFRSIPAGSIVSCVENRPGAGAAFMRSAGSFGTVMSKNSEHATVKMRSTEIRKFPLDCWAVVGQVSNADWNLRIRGKAGVSRWLGWRPEVRGIAMNPNAHPHGGGTSAKHTKRPPVSMWGIHMQNFKTRSSRPLGLVVQRKLCRRLRLKFGISR